LTDLVAQAGFFFWRPGAFELGLESRALRFSLADGR
jgi:hypothetical protein